MKTNKNPPLVCQVGGGLGNRLMCIISTLRMADILKRPFRLAWRQDAECDCKFGDLFVNGLEEIKHNAIGEK